MLASGSSCLSSPLLMCSALSYVLFKNSLPLAIYQILRATRRNDTRDLRKSPTCLTGVTSRSFLQEEWAEATLAKLPMLSKCVRTWIGLERISLPSEGL